MRNSLETFTRRPAWVAAKAAVCLAAGLLWTLPLVLQGAAEGNVRSTTGLLAVYSFQSGSGTVVPEARTGAEEAALHLLHPSQSRWTGESLELSGQSFLQTRSPAARISEAIRWSGEITVEAWIRPARADQTGPARIVTLSRDTGERNFTLGQDGDRYDVRFRTTSTTPNGSPTISSPPGTLTTNLTHLVYTRDRSGRTRIYLNAQLAAEQFVPGDTSPWSAGFRLALGNEVTGDRPWAGHLFLVALYARDLLPEEVERHFAAGPRLPPLPDVSKTDGPREESARLFESEIAGLIARHCLECHDASLQKGKLDLSSRPPAQDAGRSKALLTPGNPAASSLWKAVESDAMPEDRPPLAAKEKALLKRWIETGAVWTHERIDPQLHARPPRPQEQPVRRLALSEYVETVRSATGVEIAREAAQLLPPDLRADGFRNTAYNLRVDFGHVEGYARLAALIAERIDLQARLTEWAPGPEGSPTRLRTAIAHAGRRLLRGPLSEQEIASYLTLAGIVTQEGGGFPDALRSVVEAMLQSPRFIYRLEHHPGDGSAWPVDDWALASRLSYMLWGGPPDPPLIAAVESGALYDRRGVAAEAARMLRDPRVIDRSLQFAREWLDLDRLEDLRPDPVRFPRWSPELARDLREETLAFFKEVVWVQQRPLAALLDAQVTFATPRLAEHYGWKAKGEGLQRYDLAAIPERGGLLTQGSLLTVGGDEASMVGRGLFVMHEFLRGWVKDPPPCVDTTPVPARPGRTQRAIAESRISQPSCGGCHAKFEPLAFGLERFDGTGRFRQKDEHGNRLREDGTLLVPGTAQPVRYRNAAELMRLMASSERVQETITWKVVQFALGRPLTAADLPALERIHAEARRRGGTYEAVLTALALSDLVLTTVTEPPPSNENRSL